MREILFRGKQVDNGEWETGSLLVERMNTSDQQVMIADKMTGYPTLVLPETVGQYTGLKDKTGKKIFEGDILSGHLDELFPEDESRYPVVWHDYGWHIKCGNKSFDTLEQWWVAKFLEVIGNIYDNPEMIERGAENE